MTAVLERDAAVDAAEELGEGAAVRNVLKASDLYTAIADVVNFMAPTAVNLPMLDAVSLEFTPGQLIAAATDRFTLGVSRVGYSGAAFTVLIAGKDAKALVKMAKTLKRDERFREVEAQFAESGDAVTFRFSSGEALTVRALDLEFPKWRHLLPSDESRMGGVVGTGYFPPRMAAFAKVRVDERPQMAVFPTALESGRPGPTLVRVGPDFIGLVMPVRAPGDIWRYDRPDWVDTADRSESGALAKAGG